MSKFNYKYYKNIIDFANAAFPGAPLGIAYARGLTHERDATDIPINTYMEAQRYLEAQKRNHTRANPYTLMFDSINGQTASIIRDTVTGKRTDLGCGAGRHFIVVYDNGAVYPCELLEHIGIPEPCRSGEHQPTDPCLGNLNDYNYDMYALLASPPAEELVRWIDHHKCSCTWECAIYSKIMHSPKEWGKLAGAAVRYLFKRRVVPSTSPQVRAD